MSKELASIDFLLTVTRSNVFRPNVIQPEILKPIQDERDDDVIEANMSNH